jgi:hypothetical protein
MELVGARGRFPGIMSTVRSDGKFDFKVDERAVKDGPPLVSAFVHFSVSPAEPGPSGSSGAFRRCRGWSHPPLRRRGQPASSISGLLQQAAGGTLQPTRSHGASWRTQPNVASRTIWVRVRRPRRPEPTPPGH